MRLRELDRKRDFPWLMAFWTRRGLPPVPQEFLPPTGLVVSSDEGQLLCGGFLVKSDTNLASISFVSANPETDSALRSEALDLLITSLSGLAKQGGFKIIAAATNVPALQKRYERLGFTMTDQNVKCYGGRL